MASKQRNQAIDILRGIGIILVLVAHSMGANSYLHTFAYSFHMPLFFVVTGLFFRTKSTRDAFIYDFRRLMIPFFFTMVLMLAISFVCSPFRFNIKSPQYLFEGLIYGNGSSVNYNKMWGNFSSVGSIWFLCALFCSKQVFNYLLRTYESVTIWIASLSIGCLAAFVGQYLILPYSLIQGLTVLPFLAIGNEFRKRELLSNIDGGGRCFSLF